MTSAPLAAVTGAEGFIGSHLTEALVASGHRVRAMAQYNSFSSYGWLETLPPDVLDQVEIVLGDVRDPGSVRGLVEGAEAVYHLAALIAIPYSYRAPHSYVDTNVTGTLNVLEAVRAPGHPAAGAHLHQRDVRHRADRADHRGPPHPDPVPVRRFEGGRGPARRQLPRRASRRPVVTLRPVQHLRAAPVDARRHPDRDRPGRRGRAHHHPRATCGPPATSPFVKDTARRLPRRRHRARRGRRGPHLQRRHRRRDLGRRPGRR